MAKVYFNYSTMGSGKSVQAMINAYQYNQTGHNVLCLSPEIDNRDGEGEYDPSFGLKTGYWKSRVGMEKVIHKIPVGRLVSDIIEDIVNFTYIWFDVIIIDEVQFLSKEQIEDLFKIATFKNIPIICYGLLTDFKTELFEGSKRLIEFGAKLSVIKSIGNSGEVPVINALFIDDVMQTEGNSVCIGGDEKYRALTLREYFKIKGESNEFKVEVRKV